MSEPGAEQRRRASFITKENASELGRRGAAAKAVNQARRKADPAFALRQDLMEALPDLSRDLLKAARGIPPFDNLPPDKRLAALFKALEYAVGRPSAVDKQPAPDPTSKEGDETEQTGGIEFA
jgi:hypothetical protein